MEPRSRPLRTNTRGGWAQRNQKNQERWPGKIQKLRQESEGTNATEPAEYGDQDREERGGPSGSSHNGYPTERRGYECGAGAAGAWKAECTTARGNRQRRVSFRLQQFRTQARQNLLSEPGQALRVRRSTEVERVLGPIQHNRRFRRFLRRGQAKVKTEWGRVCLAHNMKQLAN